MPSSGNNSESTSPTRLSGNNNSNLNGAPDRKNSLDSNSSNGGGGKLATMSYDPTPYIQRARVTRPAPPKPSCNPMQFVQIKPCNLYQTAQEQLKKAEEVKKVKEIKKEEPEDWQSNLDNWKSSRRKRVEHIIDRVVEVKKLELEEHDRTRRKSKTFSEMLEERSSRRTKLASLAVYTEDESNDLSDLGIGTSSTSGKSSLSEDYDNHSVMSDNVDADKSSSDMLANHHHHLNHENGILNRDYISSPGYETSSSTAPTSSPDPCEYTYEGAIQDYKTRISRAQSNGFNRSTVSSPYSKDSTPERNTTTTTTAITNDTVFTPRRPSGSKIENRLMSFEVKSSLSNEQTNEINAPKKDLPKVDILKRRELFEKDNNPSSTSVDCGSITSQKRLSGDFTNTKSIRERLSSLEKKPSLTEESKKTNRLSGDITSLKDRLQNLERQTSVTEKSQKIDVPVVPLKDRLSSLQNAATKEEIKKPVLLVDEHQLEMLKKEELEKQHILKREMLDDDNFNSSQEILNLQDESNVDTDREDSGIHTTDVSCSVSQTDEQPELVNEESHHHINAEDGLCQNTERKLQNSDIHEKYEETASTCIPDVVQNLTLEQIPAKIEDQQVQQQQQPQLIEDNNAALSPEPTADQETSVSLSLSESPTASSQQTVIFNGKMASETGGSLENITSISQLSVEGVLGVDYNCSNSSNNKQTVVSNTNTSLSSSFTYGKNSKFDIDKFEKESKKALSANQIKYDFTNNDIKLKNNTTDSAFEKSKFVIESNNVVEDKINIEKWIEQNFEQNQSTISNINIESSNKTLTNKSSPIENQNQIETSKKLLLSDNTNITLTNKPIDTDNDSNKIKSHDYIFNTKKRNLDTKTYGEVIFDSKLLSPKSDKKLIEDSISNQNQNKLENIVNSNISQFKSNSKIEQQTTSIETSKIESQSQNPNSSLDFETVCVKIRPSNFKSKLKSPTKIPDSDSKSNLIDSKEKRHTIIETCEKIDVSKLPDPSHITTPFIDVNLEDCPNEVVATVKLPKSQNQPTKIPILTKPPLLPLPSSKSKSLPSSPSKEPTSKHVTQTNTSDKPPVTNSSSSSLPNSTVTTPDHSRNGIIVAKLEVVETKIKVTSNDTPPRTPDSSPKIPKSPISPKINIKTHPDSKPKNIFDFLKKNFSSSTDHTDDDHNQDDDQLNGTNGAVAIDNSKFYVSLTEDNFNNISNCSNNSNSNNISSGNDVNIEITRTIKTDRIVEKADSIDSDATMTNEINQLLDEEFSKLATNIEDTRL